MYKFLDDKGYLYYVSVFERENQQYYTVYKKLINHNQHISEPKRWEAKKNKLFENIKKAQVFLIEQALKNGWQKQKGLDM